MTPQKKETSPRDREIQRLLDRLAYFSSERLGTLSIAPGPLRAYFMYAAVNKGRIGVLADALARTPELSVQENTLEKKLLRIAEAAQRRGYNVDAWEPQVPQLKEIVAQADKAGAGKFGTFRISYRYLRDRYMNGPRRAR